VQCIAVLLHLKLHNVHMHRLCNLFRLNLEQQYFVLKTKNKASFSQGGFDVVTPAFLESLIFAKSSQGRRRVSKSVGGGEHY
jgi:hypothetical protein